MIDKTPSQADKQSQTEFYTENNSPTESDNGGIGRQCYYHLDNTRYNITHYSTETITETSKINT